MYTTFISTQELSNLIATTDIVVVDCRYTGGEKSHSDYLEAHIPGAVFASMDKDLSGEIIPGVTGRHPLPKVEDIENRLSNWGIGNETQVVVYDDKGGAMAARLWWMLKWLGHDAVAVLNGGWSAWKADRMHVNNSVPQKVRKEFKANVRSEMLVDADFVTAHQEDMDYLILDARAGARYEGLVEPLDPIAGHIEGAVSMPFSENISVRKQVLPEQVLKIRFERMLGDVPMDKTICYCGSGVTACHNILSMAHAGLGMPKLYAGSWSDWITSENRVKERSFVGRINE